MKQFAIFASLALSMGMAHAFQKPVVAVLPTLNTSGEKWEDLKLKQSAKIAE